MAEAFGVAEETAFGLTRALLALLIGGLFLDYGFREEGTKIVQPVAFDHIQGKHGDAADGHAAAATDDHGAKADDHAAVVASEPCNCL